MSYVIFVSRSVLLILVWKFPRPFVDEAHPWMSLVFRDVAKNLSSFLAGGSTDGLLPLTLPMVSTLLSSSLTVYVGIKGLVVLADLKSQWVTSMYERELYYLFVLFGCLTRAFVPSISSIFKISLVATFSCLLLIALVPSMSSMFYWSLINLSGSGSM